MSPTRPLICSRSIAWFLLVAGVVGAGKVCADQTYDQNNASHVWDNSTQNWDGSTATWQSGNATFTGGGIAVDVNGAINVGNITFNSGGWNIGDPTADGSLNLTGSPSNITVANVGDTDTISANIASGVFSKLGAGTLVLSGNNTFSGNVIVSAGILKIASATALGDTTGTTSANGGTLLLAGGITVIGETLNVAGSGANNVGALQVEAGGSATWAGTINLDLGARVGAQSGGTLTLSGVIQNGAGNTPGGRFVWRRAGFEAPLDAVPTPPPSEQTVEFHLNEALTNLYVGLHRELRGEHLTASRFIQVFAVDRVLTLLRLAGSAPALPDRFEPSRRAEQGGELPLPQFVPGYRGNAAAARAMLSWLEDRYPVDPAIAGPIRELLTRTGQ